MLLNRRSSLVSGVFGMAAALLAMNVAFAQAQDYPTRPIRIVVPTQPGSAQDIVVRLLQPYLEKSLGAPIVVDNRAGASTMIGTDAVAKATPDGYTLLIVPTTFTVNAALNEKLPFDPERDFEPIGILVKNPLLFSINAELPAKTLAEFVALAKTQPGKFELRLVRRLDAGASADRNVERARGHQDAAYPLQGRRAGRARRRHQ